MAESNNIEYTNKIKSLLDIFDKVGIADTESVKDAPDKYHPRNLLNDFQSIIVFAHGSNDESSNEMGGFNDYLGTIYAQIETVDYLDKLGYKAVIVEGASSDISLVRMGIAAGIGELSPVNSLVVKELGLTASIGAIITDAKLIPDDMITDVCIHCNKCLEVCPIRDEAYANGDLTKCGCNACHFICPV